MNLSNAVTPRSNWGDNVAPAVEVARINATATPIVRFCMSGTSCLDYTRRLNERKIVTSFKTSPSLGLFFRVYFCVKA